MATGNMIKGKIAEFIVEEMLREAGFKIFRFGYEHVLEGLTHKKLSKQDFYAKLIRDLPDFVIVDERFETDEDVPQEHREPAVYPIEVKFRTDGKIPRNYFIEVEDAEELIMNCEENYDEFERVLNSTSTWRECILIIVMPREPFFRVHYPGKWMKRQLQLHDDIYELKDAYPFLLIDDRIIDKYKTFVRKYLSER